ncbi:hypothetical protein SBOR_2391 [Sclerotinia borealis F-4128]|uniref:DNA mismatch repair protein HSM3 N-terminal domain-containing protein n=1 Tax=Sclerotinia borealis (strain F-4128) TaxID=1432307 RepID=W9CMZ9_SCLBF|nr:hypothetical protein SBOR_2391 [Sclerotinia borealis F-4128]
MPKMDIDDTPIFKLEELEAHLQELVKSSDVLIDTKLFDAVELQLTESNISPLIPKLLPTITQILLSTQQDPTVLASLSVKLLQPITFPQALELASEDALILALRSPVPAANILAITIIEKATKNPTHVALLSNMKGVVENYIRTWLSNPDVGVGERATRALGGLLAADSDRRSSSITNGVGSMDIDAQHPPGQGLLWRRMFQDRDIYDTIFSLCSLKTVGTDNDQLDGKQKTLAQARLLRLLPRLAALDCRTITRTFLPEVDNNYISPVGKPGLLYFAAMEMVDKEDLLMHMTLTIFFLELLDAISTTDIAGSTKKYVADMLKIAMESDVELRQSVENITVSPDSTPNLIALVHSLNRES